MNGKDLRDLQEVSSELRGVNRALSDLKTLLKGKSDDPNDIGLVGAVHDNTRFRSTIGRWLMVIGVSVAGLLINAAFDKLVQ